MTEESKEKFKLNPKNKKLIIIVACIFVVAAIATTIIIVLSHRETVGDILDLGDRYMSEMDYESAIREYKRAIEIDPKSEDAYLKLAEAYIAIGDRDSAIETLEDGYEATQSDRILERLNELREELHTPEHAKELSVATEPDKLEYYVGETLDLSGLTFTVTYEDGTTEEISEGYTYDVKTLEESGTVEVTVEYGGAKATINVTVVENPGTETEPSETEPSPTEPSPTEPSPTEPSPTEPSPTRPSTTETAETEPPMTDAPVPAALTGISIKTQPKKTTYYVGEKLDTSGLTLTATYSNGKTETITRGFTCSPTTLNTAGTQKITVTYGGKTATVNVTVKEPTLAEDFTWTLENGVLTLSGHGLMPNYEYDPNNIVNIAPWEERIGEIKKVVINDGILNIGDYAFEGCDALTTITIPGSVTSIGENVFLGCYSLKMITIPGSVKSIGDGAFAWCGLTSITIPDSVTSIGCSAFVGCPLKNITIPDSVTSIGDNAFHWSGLTTITIPNSITSIGDSLFLECTNLTTVTIPNSVTSIGDGAFSLCDSLASITIPDSVTSIGEEAFENSGLKSITIPSSVKSIGERAFMDCSELTEISVDKNNLNYCSVGVVLFSKDIKTLISCPAGISGNYIIPNSVTSIGDGAFYGCTGLTSITIPASVTSIEGYAFDGCTSLTTITIPDSVTSIGYDVFRNCSNITIHGHAGSYAEQYAKDNDIPFVAD